MLDEEGAEEEEEREFAEVGVGSLVVEEGVMVGIESVGETADAVGEIADVVVGTAEEPATT